MKLCKSRAPGHVTCCCMCGCRRIEETHRNFLGGDPVPMASGRTRTPFSCESPSSAVHGCDIILSSTCHAYCNFLLWTFQRSSSLGLLCLLGRILLTLIILTIIIIAISGHTVIPLLHSTNKIIIYWKVQVYSSSVYLSAPLAHTAMSRTAGSHSCHRQSSHVHVPRRLGGSKKQNPQVWTLMLLWCRKWSP